MAGGEGRGTAAEVRGTSQPLLHPTAPSTSLTSNVLQCDGQGRRQLPWGPKGTVAQLFVGTDACRNRMSG